MSHFSRVQNYINELSKGITLTEARETLKEPVFHHLGRVKTFVQTRLLLGKHNSQFFPPPLFLLLPERTKRFSPIFQCLVSYRSCRRFSCLERLRSIPRRHNEPNRSGKHTRIAHTYRSFTMFSYNENADRSRDRNINSSLLN